MRSLRALSLVMVSVIASSTSTQAQQRPTEERGGTDRFVAQSSGAATLAIPIPVPVGTGGFEPDLSLRYSSQMRDTGPFGVGWQLTLSQIRRTTRFGVPAYDATDSFELDGELLIEDPGNPNQFRSATESFSRLTHDIATDSWVVELPNGLEMRFGTTKETQIRLDGSTNPQADVGPVGVWLASEIEDPHGNVIRLEYERGIDEGTAYPKAITYSYRGGVLVGGVERKVEFVLEPRPDPLHRFTGAIESFMTRRVAEIRSTVGGQTFRRLMLTYSDVADYTVHRSRLVESQLFGSDCPTSEADPWGNCAGLPAHDYTYTDRATLLDPTESSNWKKEVGWDAASFQDGDLDKGAAFADLNGDGRLDFMRSRWETGIGFREVYLAEESDGFGASDPGWAAALDAVGATYYAIEVRSGGLCDWDVDPYGSGTAHFAIRGESAPTTRPSAPHQVVDLNDDGLPDLIVSWEFGEGFRDKDVCGLPADEHVPASVANKAVLLNTGSGWILDANLTNTLPTFYSTFQEVLKRSEMPDIYVAKAPNHLVDESSILIEHLYEDDHGVRFAELNGDGRPDLLISRTNAHGRSFTSTAYLNTPAGWVQAPEFTPPQPFVAEHIWEVVGANQYTASSDTGLRIVDLNGDGLSDLIKTALPSSHTTQDPVFSASGVWLNTGRGWCGVSTGCPDAAKYALPSGFSFIVEKDLGIYVEEIFIGSGTRDVTVEPGIVSSSFVFQDVNADGLVDLLQADELEYGVPDGKHAWIHDPTNPTSVWVEDIRFQPTYDMRMTELVGAHKPIGVRLLDTDHDGILDFAHSWGGTNESYTSRMRFSDLLESHDTGRGGLVEWEYTAAAEIQLAWLASAAATDSTTLGEDTGAGMVRWQPGPVVSSVTTSGVDVPTATHDFTYTHPRWCPVHRSGLGFRIAQVTNDQDDTRVQTRYWQAHGRAGQASASRVYDTDGIRHQQTFTWQVVDGSQVIGSVAGAHVGRMTATASQGYDGSWSAPGSLQTTTSTIDDQYGFNFVSQIVTTRPSGTMIVDRTPEAANLTTWIAGLVDEQESRDPGGVVYRRQRIDYLAGSALPVEVESDLQLQESGATPEGTAIAQRTYDAFGNVTSTQDAEGRVREFCYDGDASFPLGGTCPPPPAGPASSTHSVLVGIKDRLGAITSLESDLGSGEALTVSLYNGDLSWVVTDAFDRPLEHWAQPAAHAQPTLRQTTTYFDGTSNTAGQPYVEVEQEVGDSTSIRETRYVDGFGQAMRSVFETPTGYAGRLINRDYRGRVTHSTPEISCGSDEHCQVTPPAGVEEVRTFDVLNRVLSIDSPAGGLTAVDYSVRTFTPPTGSASPGNYDVVTVTNPDTSVTSRTFDGDRLVLVEECGSGGGCGSSEKTYYEYVPTGSVETIWNASEDYVSANNRIRYLYDTLGRVREIDDPDGGITTQTYDLVGNLDVLTNARSGSSDHDYDALDRLVSVDRPGSEPDVSLFYDSHTRRVVLTYVGSDVITGHLYDDFGREARKVVSTQGVTLITDFEYDLVGRTTAIQYPDFTAVHYDYEGAYLKTVCGGTGECTGATTWISDVQYDSIGREASVFDRHGTRSYEYDPVTYQLESKTYQEAGSGDYWLDLSYVYDGAGRISSVADGHDGPGVDGIDASASMTYDDHSRLESWTWNGSTRWFKYDVLGNLTGRDLPASVAPANQIYGDPTRPHAITSRTDTSKVYEYDADGNVTRRGGQYLKYNSLNQVECVGSSPASCDLAVYGYDAAGTLAYEASTGETRIFVEDLFVWQTSNNQAISHVFANGRQIGEQQRNSASLRTGWLPPGWTFPVDPADLLLAALGASGVLLLVLAWRSGTIALIATRPRQASTAIFLGIAVLTPAPALAGGGSGSITRRLTHQDHLGTRVLLVSDTPDVIYRRVFEPFGEVVAESVGTEGQIRYLTGKRESVATRDGVGGPGLVNFGARWYDPEIGRFLSIDPIVQAVGDPQTHNPYTYVRNDPVGLIDPNGLGFEKTFKRIVGGLAIAVGVILIAYQVPQAGYGMITYGVGLILETASDQRTQSWGLGLQALGLAMVAVGLALSSVTTPTTTPPTFPNQAGGGVELIQSVASAASRSAALGAADAAEELAEVESSRSESAGISALDRLGTIDPSLPNFPNDVAREAIQEEKTGRLEPQLQELESEAESLVRKIARLEKFGLTGSIAASRRFPWLGGLVDTIVEGLRGRLRENLFEQDNLRERLGRPRIYTDRKRNPRPVPELVRL